jgi:fimbrial chaperone protein
VVVELSAREPRAILTLRNGGADPVRIEVKPSRWAQADDGQMVLAPAEDLIVYPPIVALGPGEERHLRVGTASPGPEGAERSYRIFLEELPPAEKPGDPSQVVVLSRIGIPVFVAPERPEARAVLAGLSLGQGGVAFALRNTGTVRVRPSRVRLEGLSADGAQLFAKDLEAWYVLAGGERRFEVALPAETCGKVRTLAVEAALEKEVLRARAQAPGGACAR